MIVKFNLKTFLDKSHISEQQASFHLQNIWYIKLSSEAKKIYTKNIT